ncbi:MAG: hypothetical protein Q8858_09145 [Bacteroidota bacterium]|nr:hypothetical protein [Bacteroidota bacterium]
MNSKIQKDFHKYNTFGPIKKYNLKATEKVEEFTGLLTVDVYIDNEYLAIR